MNLSNDPLYSKDNPFREILIKPVRLFLGDGNAIMAILTVWKHKHYHNLILFVPDSQRIGVPVGAFGRSSLRLDQPTDNICRRAETTSEDSAKPD